MGVTLLLCNRSIFQLLPCSCFQGFEVYIETVTLMKSEIFEKKASCHISLSFLLVSCVLFMVIMRT